MPREIQPTVGRRQFLAFAGVAAATASVAGTGHRRLHLVPQFETR